MNLLLNNIEYLDHRNVYIIKKIVSTLMSEFHDAMENGNKQKANTMRDLAKKTHEKILPNVFWANRIDKILTEMTRKLHK